MFSFLTVFSLINLSPAPSVMAMRRPGNGRGFPHKKPIRDSEKQDLHRDLSSFPLGSAALPTLSNTLPRQEQHLRNLQHPRCITAYDSLFENNAALQTALDNLSEGRDDFYANCTESPCIVNEDEVVEEAIIESHRDACHAANGVLYEYDLYVYCSNSTDHWFEDQFLNWNYCFPQQPICTTNDVTAYTNSFLSDTATGLEEWFADFNYVCDGLDVDFLGSETKIEATCNDNSLALNEASASLETAELALSDQFWEAYDECIDTGCVFDEDTLEGSQKYLDECVDAGGRIWEYDIKYTCTNPTTNAVRNEKLSNVDFCYSRDACPSAVTFSQTTDFLRYLSETTEEYLGEDWECDDGDLDLSRIVPMSGSTAEDPEEPASSAKASLSIVSSVFAVFVALYTVMW